MKRPKGQTQKCAGDAFQPSKLFHLMICVLSLWFVIGMLVNAIKVEAGMVNVFVWIRFLVLCLTLPIIIAAMIQYRRMEHQGRYLCLLLDCLQEGVLVSRADGSIEYANAKAAVITKNHSISFEALFENWGFFNYENNTPMTIEDHPLALALKGNTVHQLVHAVKGDTEKFLMIDAAPFVRRNGKIDGALTVFRDITDYKRLERQNESRGQLYRLLAENVSDLVGVVDSNGIVLYASPSHKNVLGIELSEYVGESAFTRVHPEDIDRVQNKFAQVVSENSGVQCEFRFLHSDGHSIVVDAKAEPVFDKNGEITNTVIIARDITQNKRAEKILLGQNQILNQIARGNSVDDVLNEIIFQMESVQEKAKCGVIVFRNNRVEYFTRSQPFELKNAMNSFELQDLKDSYLKSEMFVTNYENHPDLQRIRDILVRNHILGFWSKPIFSPNGVCIGIFIVAYDEAAGLKEDNLDFYKTYVDLAGLVIHQRNSASKIEYLAYRDPLTGLFNRWAIDSMLGKIQISDSLEAECAILHMDIDRFKSINDTFGHIIGDQIIKELAQRLLLYVRNEDVVCRVGGDEFVILLNRSGSKMDVRKIANEILYIVEDPIYIDKNEFLVTGSIGVAFYPEHGVSSAELLKNAETAMYDAKSHGPSLVSVYCTHMSEELYERIMLEKDIRLAIDHQKFALVYQPKIDIPTCRLIGAEVLIRWSHPEQGNVSPGKFIPVAEEMGIIASIDQWVLESALKQLQRWKAAGYPIVPLAVNISAQQLNSAFFPDLIRNMVNFYEIEPKWLELEITETAIVTNEEVSAKNIRELVNLGISVALDDFGTGYSALSYLTRFEISTIKMDRSFIDGLLQHDSIHENIVKTIILLAKNLGMKVVAEGIETKEQWEFLLSLQCDIGQGFLFSKPVSAESFEFLMKNGAMILAQ